MSESDVHSVLVDRLANSRNCTRDEVLLELERAGGIDSLEGVELVIEAEQTFGIVIADSEITSDVCRTIPMLVALIHSKLESSDDAKGKADQ